MNRIGVEIYAFNERSIKMFENVGFVKEGIIRQLVFKKNNFEDEYMYGLLKSEWKR
jgi:RimJ/RimL family protein N-acetyltransferase